MKVHLFITCLNDAVFPKTGMAVTTVLERLGYEVLFDERQTCCGQMHLNSGHAEEAAAIAHHWLEVFQDAGVIVAPSGSCVAHVREMFSQAAAWTGDRSLAALSENLEGRIFEFSEFLVARGHLDVGAFFPHRVTYHPTCHGLRALGLGMAPVKLLERVKGLEYVPLEDAEQCCGFGGTFSVKNSETSTAMLTDKMAAIRATGAEYCVAVDNSCLMHIGGGLRKDREGPRVIHLAEVLASTEGV